MLAVANAKTSSAVRTSEKDAMTPSLAWVDTLPVDFYRRDFEVKPHFSPILKAAEGVDLLIRTVLASLLTGVSIPSGYTGEKIAAIFRDDTYRARWGNDNDIFHQPRQVTAFDVQQVRRPLGVKQGVFERLRWRSCHETNLNASNLKPQSIHVRQPNNDWVTAYLWRHGDSPRPTVIFVHGFMAATWEINEFFLGMKSLYELGCDVVLKTLPHHGERRSSMAKISGLDYVSGGIESLNQAVIQSTYDIRTLVDYLKNQRHVEKVGLTGLSLGGYTSALIAGLENRLEFVMPVIPIISIPDAMMEWKPLDQALLRIMRKFSLDIRQLRQTMAFHSPMSRSALLPSTRLMIIAGMGDKMASPRHAEALQKHWQGCDLHWFEGSHALPLQRARTDRAKQIFLEKIGFLDAV